MQPLEEENPQGQAAQLTVALCDHPATPNALADAIIETLIEMAHESRADLWLDGGGLSADLLARLYSLYETGAGCRRARTYSAYEIGRQSKKAMRLD